MRHNKPAIQLRPANADLGAGLLARPAAGPEDGGDDAREGVAAAGALAHRRLDAGAPRGRHQSPVLHHWSGAV